MKFTLESLQPVLANRGRLRCVPGWHLDSQWARGLRDYDLWYVWAGRGSMQTSQGEVNLRPGIGLWMRPGRRYEAEQDSRERLGVSFIHFRLQTPRRLVALSEFVPPVEVFETSYPDYFNAALKHIVRPALKSESVRESDALLFKSLLLEIVEQVRLPGIAPDPNGHHHEAIARTVATIQDAITATLPVGKLARIAGYSLDHFSRVFHEVTGESPKDYMLRVRMERAMTLLKESSQTISQIADGLGYQDVGFFSRQFKQKVGLSPGQFRFPAGKEQ